MDFDHQREGNSEVLTFAPPMRPVLLFFAIVSGAIVLATALTLMIRPVSYPLLAILLLTGGLVGRLCLLTLELMTTTTVRLDPEGVRIDRLLGGSSHAWDTVEGIKLLPSVGSLADDPSDEPKARLGLGLFLKGSTKVRQHALDPDELIITASDTFERQLDRSADVAAKYQARLGHANPSRNRISGGPSAPTQFRRQARPAPEPVAVGQNYVPRRPRGAFGHRER